MKKIEVLIKIKCLPEQVISAFIKPEMLQHWWAVERALIDARPGGLYILTWNVTAKGFGYVSTGLIRKLKRTKELIVDNFTYLNPEKQFLGPMSLTLSVEKKSDITEAYLCQDGYKTGTDWDWYYEAVKQAWPGVMGNLKAYLENGES